MVKSRESLLKIADNIYSNLSKWDLRRLSFDSPEIAAIFVIFLKYLSDNRKQLKLEFESTFEFENFSLLYSNTLHYSDMITHIRNVENQLGLTGYVLSSFVGSFELLTMEKELSQIMDMIKDIDLKIEGSDDYTLIDTLNEFLMMRYARDARSSGNAITEINLSKLMSSLARIEDGMEVYDFASGRGILLTELVKFKELNIFAQEIDHVSAAVSIMLLTIARAENIHVYCDDTFQHPLTLNWEPPKIFDRVVSTPPFSLKMQQYDQNAILDSAFKFGLGYSSKSDLVFLQHAIASLKSNGLAVVLLPIGALFRGGREAKLREAMIGYIDAIIELPAGIVQNSGIKTAIVVLNNHAENKKVFLTDLSNENTKGYFERNGRTGVRITTEGVQKIAAIVNEKKSINDISLFISKEEIIKNNAVLTASTYLNALKEKNIDIIDIEMIRQERTELLSELMELEKLQVNILAQL